MATISEAFAVAVVHHRAGRLQAAEQIYLQILSIEPNHAPAWHLLGVVHYQRGNHQAAADHIVRAIGLDASAADFRCNLGNVYQRLDKPDEATACYRRALELKPDYAEAHCNLGNVFKHQGKRDEAIACYRRALELKPDFAEAHTNLGTVLQELHRYDEAVDCFRRALELKPDFVEADYNCGNALQEQGKPGEAADCYRRALALQPDFVDALHNLGIALQELARRDEAVACYRRALELRPDFAEALYNLGNVLREQARRDEAVACYRRALELKPDFLVALSALVHELQYICHWEGLKRLSQRVIELIDENVQSAIGAPVPPFSLLSLPTMTTAAQQLRCARQWVERKLKMPAELAPHPPLRRRSRPKSKLTIGYLSADFRSHAIAVTVAELFEKHDRGRFAIFGYSYGPDDGSPMRQRLVKAFDRFVDVRDASFAEAARRIAADEVDILVDLTGYTLNGRTQILAIRPAPIQVNYLGYTGTMGAAFMDYIIVDDFIVPPEQQPFFTEKLVHLPGSYQVNDSQREISPHTPSRAECGLPQQGFVFCCFNNNYKITPEVFTVWMRLLQAVPGSVLWLLEDNPFAATNLRREAQARGVAAERLVFATHLALADHLARHRLADLFLDTLPYNAHTTASEALWAGCPLLTIAGQTFASRVAGSLLRTLGLPELITTRLEDYEEMALRLARDTRQLAELRARLQTNRTTSALFDAGPFAATLEKAYQTMWEICAAGEKPRAFRVSPNVN